MLDPDAESKIDARDKRDYRLLLICTALIIIIFIIFFSFTLYRLDNSQRLESTCTTNADN